MNNSWCLQNGRIIDPENSTDRVGDLVIINGSIAHPDQKIPGKIEEIDVKGCWVVPGLTDMHVHLREPGEEYKEDVVSGTLAAAAGGFTAVASMPNTSPVNDNGAVTELILDRAGKGHARVYPIGAISKGLKGESLAEFGEMRDAGAVGVTDDGLPVRDSQLMRRALEYAHDFELTVIAHSEDPALSTGVMNEGVASTRLGLKGNPVVGESIMVYREIALAEYTGKKVHIAHVSTAQSVALIRAAKERGVRVTAETAPHYFTLTEEAVAGYDTNAKMNPPLRSAVDREAVRKGLADGTIDAIATDHAPHSILEKEVEFDMAANGIIGLETALPLSLALVRDGLINERRLVELLAVNPASILGVSRASLSPGSVADVTVIDPDSEYTYGEQQVVSKSKNSPFLDWQLKGRAVLTIVEGRLTHRLSR